MAELSPQFKRVTTKKGGGWSHSFSSVSRDHTVHKEPSTHDYYYLETEPGNVSVDLEINHTGAKTMYSFPLNNDYDDWWRRDAKVGETIPLFQMEHEPAKSEISELFSTRSSRVSSMTLLGIAAEQAKTEKGTDLTIEEGENTLSPHSRKLAKHAEALGVVNVPENIGDNNNDFPEEPWSPPYFSGAVIPESDVKAGRKRVRDSLRPPALSPQFQALQKFEQDRDTPYNPSNDPNAMKLPGVE